MPEQSSGPSLEHRLRALELEVTDLRKGRPRRAHAPARPSRPRRILVVMSVIMAVGLLPMAAVASDTFSDVPNDSNFHDAINNIAGAGITAGDPAGSDTYQPQKNVNRQQMAAFLSRGLGRVAGTEDSQDYTADGTQTIASITVDTGGVTGGTGFVLVTGSATGVSSSDTTCPCAVGVRVRNATAGVEPDFWEFEEVTNTPTYFGFRVGSATQSWVFEVPTGTTQTFELRATVDMTGASGDITVQGHITAIYVPFGSTGGSTLDLSEFGSTAVDGVAD